MMIDVTVTAGGGATLGEVQAALAHDLRLRRLVTPRRQRGGRRQRRPCVAAAVVAAGLSGSTGLGLALQGGVGLLRCAACAERIDSQDINSHDINSTAPCPRSRARTLGQPTLRPHV
jgi:hypothetical protein